MFWFANLAIFSWTWEKSKNMNYELDYNGVINQTHTPLKEYFDGFLSFPRFKVLFLECFHFAIEIWKDIFILWIEISFKSACMSRRSSLLCRTGAQGDCFYKEVEMRQIWIKLNWKAFTTKKSCLWRMKIKTIQF